MLKISPWMIRYRKIMIVLLLTTGALINPFESKSQNNTGYCGTDHVFEINKNLDPGLEAKRESLEKFTREFVNQASNKSAPTYVIPVVVHIFHNYGPENIPSANVHDMLRIVNEDFQANQPDTGAIIPAFKSIIGGLDIEFRLASIDPNGNCTDGINRVYDPVYTYQGGCINGNCGNPAPVHWPKDKYLNIWVVNVIDVNGQFLGYSSFPGFVAGRDGIVIQYNVFGSLSPSSNNNFNARYMSHEIGHYLNLFHVWGNGGANGSPGNCSFDDQVGDTPNTVGTQNCNLAFVSCGSLDNVQNLMDYSYGSCSAGLMFTIGQMNRSDAALNSSIGDRNNLWSPANLLATGTDDNSQANLSPCTPISEFTPAVNSTICQGGTISFRERAFNGIKDSTWTYLWNFPGGTPSVSNDPQPIVSYNSVGDFDVSLTVSNSTGNSQPKTKTNLISVLPGAGTFNAPYVDKISDPSWPNSSDPTLVWTVTKPQGSLFQFQRSTNAYYSPPSSIYLNNFSYNGTNEHILETPPMNLSALLSGAAFLNFQVAYSRKQSENEILYLDVSEDCGQTFSLEKFWIANNYVSVPSSNASAFVPADTSEWRFISYDISKFAGQNGTIFRFRFAANRGNNLFFDDIAVSDVSQPEPLTGFSEELSASFNLYPNPNTGRFNLEFFYDGKNSVTAQIVDVIGKTQELNLDAQITNGWNIIEIDTRQYDLQSGIYILKMLSGKSSFTKRVIIE